VREIKKQKIETGVKVMTVPLVSYDEIVEVDGRTGKRRIFSIIGERVFKLPQPWMRLGFKRLWRFNPFSKI
jgi:hypothetical protein